jgi:hypothetical protein
MTDMGEWPDTGATSGSAGFNRHIRTYDAPGTRQTGSMPRLRAIRRIQTLARRYDRWNSPALTAGVATDVPVKTYLEPRLPRLAENG